MSHRETCPQCGGEGLVDVLDIEDLVAAHLMNTPDAGMIIAPEQVRQLAKTFGLLPEEPAPGHA